MQGLNRLHGNGLAPSSSIGSELGAKLAPYIDSSDSDQACARSPRLLSLIVEEDPRADDQREEVKDQLPVVSSPERSDKSHRH